MTTSSLLSAIEDPVPLPDWDPQAIVRLLGNNSARNSRLLEKFLGTGADTLIAMNQALAGDNMVELTRLAHGLKSSARSVGAMVLGEQCAALEKASSSLDPSICEALLSIADAHFTTVRLIIQEHLQTPA